MHARSTLGLDIKSRCAGESGVAEAILKGRLRKSLYSVSHEERSVNYNYGNAGSGHAHHHDGTFCVTSGFLPFSDVVDETPPPPPEIGSPGTSQYIFQSWLPNAADTEITVAWSPRNFLQVDLSQLIPGVPLASRASLAADGGLFGSVELLALLDEHLITHIDTRLTGIFDGLSYELASHPSGVVSLQFRQPLIWIVPGDAETFDISLDGSIDGVVDVSESIPEPTIALLVGTGLVGLLASAWRRRRQSA